MAGVAAAGDLDTSIQKVDERAANVNDFFAGLSEEIGKRVPFDGVMLFGVDPDTMLATAPARMVNMDAALCFPFWHAEHHETDSLLFRDLARQSVPVGSLRDATDGRPMRSQRYREFLVPQGYDDEVRIAFRTGRTTWAVGALYRAKGRAPFDTDELRVLASISQPVGVALRTRAVLHSPVA